MHLFTYFYQFNFLTNLKTWDYFLLNHIYTLKNCLNACYWNTFSDNLFYYFQIITYYWLSAWNFNVLGNLHKFLANFFKLIYFRNTMNFWDYLLLTFDNLFNTLFFHNNLNNLLFTNFDRARLSCNIRNMSFNLFIAINLNNYLLSFANLFNAFDFFYRFMYHLFTYLYWNWFFTYFLNNN